MKKISKLLLIFVVSIFGIVSLTGCNKKQETQDKLTIVSTNFPGYDFARAITMDNTNIKVKMLLKPGAESHTFEPTPEDIKTIKNSDIFISVGGDSDEWVDDILSDIDTDKTKIIKLIDLVDAKEEVTTEGMESDEKEESEEEAELDEHVWTSPKNAIEIINKLKKEIINIDSDEKSNLESNANNYVNKLNDLDTEFKSIVKTAKRKEIIVGDRFPLRYFADEYGLSYYAAFPGCSEQTEASAKTISFLANKVKEDKIPVVLKIELSSGNIANTIAKETNTKVLEFNSAHNISQSDFDAGTTYVDIMTKNAEVLKEALN